MVLLIYVEGIVCNGRRPTTLSDTHVDVPQQIQPMSALLHFYSLTETDQ